VIQAAGEFGLPGLSLNGKCHLNDPSKQMEFVTPPDARFGDADGTWGGI